MGVLFPILMYHQIGPETDAAFEPYLYQTPETLKRQIEEVQSTGLTFVTLDKGWHDIEAGRRARNACLTFDDLEPGFIENALPVLQEAGVTATVFVIANQIVSGNDAPPDGPGLDASDLRLLQDAGLEVGSHAVSHRELHRMPDTELRSELTESKARIEEATGTPCTTLCFPRGRFSPRVEAAAREAGYLCAVSTLRGSVQSMRGRYRMKRIRMHGERFGLKLRYTLTRLYDWINCLRRMRERARFASEDATAATTSSPEQEDTP